MWISVESVVNQSQKVKRFVVMNTKSHILNTWIVKGGFNVVGYLFVLAIAVIWGYIADLRKGQIGWFIGRVIFMLAFYQVTTLIMG